MTDAVIEDIVVSGDGGHFLVLLRAGEEDLLPIVIDAFQATALVQAREGRKGERPGPHDLMLASWELLGVKLERVQITDLTDDTFFAVVVLEKSGLHFDLDARPSDALILAASAGCPIQVSTKVLQENAFVDLDPLDDSFEA